MCRQNSPVLRSAEEATSADESLLIYCKPVELYNILYHRALHNPSFLRRCLRYKMRARHKRRMRAGIVIFNYRDGYNQPRKSEVTEDFTCPFCLMQCVSFTGLRFHLCSSHDLFNFEFWVTEDYQEVTTSVKVDKLRSENAAEGVDPPSQSFFFCSKRRQHIQKKYVQNDEQTKVKFLELDYPSLATKGIQSEFLEKDGGDMPKTFPSQKDFQNGRCEEGTIGPDSTESLKHVSRINTPGVSSAMPQSSADPECCKLVPRNDATLPAKKRKLSMDCSNSKNQPLLQKRLFIHSQTAQPMALEEVLSDRDSEDEVDNDIASIEDQRMLDDFVDVTKEEKKLMHMWNSFVRKQRVLADSHVPWACQAFCKLHGTEMISSPALYWRWRFFMIKLHKHGLLDGCVINNCTLTIENCRDETSDSVEE